MAGSFTSLYSEFQRQVTMVSLKEVYGYAVIAAVVILIAILASDYRNILDAKHLHMLKPSHAWKLVRARSDNSDTEH